MRRIGPNEKTTKIWLEAAVFPASSIRNSCREIGLSLPKEPAASSPQSPSVIAHAQRHHEDKNTPVAHARRSSDGSQQPAEDDEHADGLGLASMIRNDSLGDLSAMDIANTSEN